jgi:nucleoporin POM152
VSDRHYSDIKLDEAPIRQTVHPLANVDMPGLRNGIIRRKLYSCSGDNIDIDLEAKGNPPLSLNYLLSYGSKFENRTVEISAGRSKLGLVVPKELNSESGASGKLSVTLLSIQDADGRVRKLPAPTVEVDIHRQKPSVRFAKAGRTVITEGDSAQAPLRLTGDAPWEVTYALNGGKAKKVSLGDANNHLTLNDAGVYRLVEVRDANCPGTVTKDDTFEISYKPRPKVELVQNSAISLTGKTYRHKGFCMGGEDQVAFRFNGESTIMLVELG